jgi:hypothetical protein
VLVHATTERLVEDMYTTTSALGATRSNPVRISDATSGTAFKSPKGFLETYGDYGEIAITNDGDTFGAWGRARAGTARRRLVQPGSGSAQQSHCRTIRCYARRDLRSWGPTPLARPLPEN